MTDKSPSVKIIAKNRRASHDYHLEKRFEAGIALKGSEVKSCRNAKVQLVDAYAYFEGAELFLYKAHISEFKQGGPYFNHEAQRKRKLLLHKRELLKLKSEIQEKGYTLLPTAFYLKKGYIKVELALAKGKSKGDKRQDLKKKDVQRSMEAAKRRSR